LDEISTGSDEYDIGGQTRADFFKSLHESAKSASGKLFTDFLQTFFHEMHTLCRLFADFFCGSTTLMHTFCTLSVANDSSSADFMHTFSVFCRPDADLMQTKSVQIAESLQTICTPILYFADLMQT
jgi:hypothetical protein